MLVLFALKGQALKHGSKCEGIQWAAAEVYCEGGYIRDDGLCYIATKKSSKQACPHGYKLDRFGACYHENKFASTWTCPKGYARVVH